MLCTECARIDLGEVFSPASGDTQQDALLFEIIQAPGRFHISVPVPHGKTFGDMETSAADGCELCQAVVAQYHEYLAWDQDNTLPPGDTPMLRVVETTHRAYEEVFNHTPKRVAALVFCAHKTTLASLDEFYSEPWARRASVELFVEAGDFFAQTGDVEYHGAGAADDPQLIRKWLQDCRSTHQWCRRWCRKPNRKLPTRVIDVEPWSGSDYVRLVSSKECEGDYAALSHCWGTSLVNKTTKALEASYGRGMRIASLCKTFQDAIKVTRNLGLRYLWIDALCIIQDDTDDWRREAETMADVYANASVTLAATASVDGTGGLFHPRQPLKPDLALKWTRAGSSTPELIYWRAESLTTFEDEVLKAPLNQRGWVMQERTLSTRIIHFARDQLFWECQEDTLSETNVPYFESSRIAAKPATLLAQGTLTKRLWDQYEMNVVWKEIVDKYTGCQLTYQTDKLVAVAGIAKSWARACGDRYVSGLWQSTLPLDLFWRPRGPSKEGTARLPFPTWSWASSSSQVSWFEVMSSEDSNTHPIENMLSDLQVSINGSLTESFFTRIQEGTLFLTGHIKRAFLKTTILPDRFMVPETLRTVIKGREGADAINCTWEDLMAAFAFQHMTEYQIVLPGMNQDGEESAGFQLTMFDVDPPPVLNKPVPTLLLFRATRRATDKEMLRYADHVMFLESQQEPDHYQRIGIGVICWYPDSASAVKAHESSWFHDAERVKIRIS